MEGYLDDRNRWGIGRGQLDYARDDVGTDATVTLSQAWSTLAGTRLSTALAYQWSTSTALAPTRSGSEASVSINGGGELTARLGFDANVRWAVALGGPGAPAVMANVALTWRVARDWLLLGSYYEYRIGSWTDVTVTSPLAPPLATVNPALSQRGAFLTIRYERASGTHFVPLGGASGAGSGQLTGTIYLDANDNNQIDAGEEVAPNVTVFSTAATACARTATDTSPFRPWPPAITRSRWYRTIWPCRGRSPTRGAWKSRCGLAVTPT